MISARNQLPAVVKSVKLGSVMAEIVMTVAGDCEVVAAITRDSAERLDLRPGDKVAAIVKASKVMVSKG